MDLTKRSWVVYGLLVAVWALVIGWQIEEHVRFREYEKTALRRRAHSIANTLGAVIKYREDGKRIEQHGIADLVKQGVKQAFEKGLAHG